MGEGNALDAQIRSPLSTVEQGKYAVTIRDTGMLTLSKYSATQYRTSFYLRLTRGEGASLSARARIGTHIEDRGITMRFDRQGVIVDSSGTKLFERRNIGFAQDSLLEVHLYSDSHIFQAVADCDTIIKMRIGMMESDEMIVQALPNSEVMLMAPNWQFLPWFY